MGDVNPFAQWATPPAAAPAADATVAPPPAAPAASPYYSTEPEPADRAPVRISVTPKREPADANPFAQWESGAIDTIKGHAKSYLGGVQEGAYELAGLPGDARELFHHGIDWIAKHFDLPRDKVEEVKNGMIASMARAHPMFGALATAMPSAPTSEEVRTAAESVVGPSYKPQTPAEDYSNTAGKFTPGALLAPMRSVISPVWNAFKFGVVPGLASETAGKQTEGSDIEPYARVAAGLGTGFFASLLSRPSSVSAAVRGELPSWLTAQHFDAADRILADAAARGVRLTPWEALSQATGRPVGQNIQRLLESSPRTRAGMEDFMSERPATVQGMIDRSIGPRTANAEMIGPAVGEAADATLNQARQAINNIARPYYNHAETQLLTPAEMRQVRTIPWYEEARAYVRGNPEEYRNVTTLPDNSIGFLDAVAKRIEEMARDATNPMRVGGPSKLRESGLVTDAGNVKEAAVTSAASQRLPAYATALQIEEGHRARYLEPLMRGPLGKLADKDLTTQRAIEVLFPSGPVATPQEVGAAVTLLSRQNPWAAQQLVRKHIEMTLDAAFNAAGRGPQAAQFGGATFAHDLVGSPILATNRMGNMRAAVEALPNGPQVWQGFERVLEIAQATGQRMPVGSRTSFNEQDLKRLATGTATGNVVKHVLQPGEWVHLFGDLWSKMQFGRNMDLLATLSTDPRAMQILRRVAALPAGSTEANLLGARAIAQAHVALAKTRSTKVDER